MRSLAAAAFFALLLPGISDAKKPLCTVRAHAEANEQDGAPFSTQLRSPTTGRNIVMEKTPTISERDIVSYRVYPAADGSFGALFVLDDHGKLALDTLSIEHRGRFLYIFVNGRPLAELQIDRRVADGKLFVANGLTNADLALMEKAWPAPRARKK